MSLHGKNIPMFLETIYEDLEFWYPYLRMKEEGADVTVISPKVDTYVGKHGLHATADRSIDKVQPVGFDALIIPGGHAPDHMRRSPLMVEFVKCIHDDGGIVAAICHAPWMLASAGILRGRTVTSFYSLKDDITNAGATWVDREVVRDENIITSRNPRDLPAFCRAIIESLE